MKRVGWFSLVFSLTVLAGLPARWLLAPVAAEGVSGSLWQGQAQRLGQVGPVAWHWQPWRLRAQVELGFQGKAGRSRSLAGRGTGARLSSRCSARSQCLRPIA